MWDVHGKTMEKLDWITSKTNANNKPDNLEGCMNKNGHNSHTDYEVYHQPLFIRYRLDPNFYYVYCIQSVL